MRYNYHVIILGAGSAGLTVASGCSVLGARVALIESEKMGGDCLNTGCVPSKAFLKCAHLAGEINASGKFGLNVNLETTDIIKVMDWVKSSIHAIKPHDSKEHMESLGVDVFLAKGKIIDAHSVSIGDKTLTAKNIVIATGSSPLVSDIPGLKAVPYYTNLNIFDMKKLPKHLIVLGGGMIGTELGQGFRQLGSKVTIIERLPKLFVNEDNHAGVLMEEVFRNEGIDLQLSSEILSVSENNGEISVNINCNGASQTINGDALLVALGRNPNTQELGLENLGIKTDDKGFILTDKKLRTDVKNIYAAGDVTGPYLLTNMAGYQASIIIYNMLFNLGKKVDYSQKAWTTYTKPEVAHVGFKESEARAKNIFGQTILSDIAENDRAIVQGDTPGFLKLILNKKNTIIGATIVSQHAGELLPLASMAIKKKMKAAIFMNLIFSYPTVSEIYLDASLKHVQKSLKDWQKKLLKLLFFR